SSSSGSSRTRTSAATQRSEVFGSRYSGRVLRMPNGTPRTLRQRHRQYVNERTKRPQTVMWILKAARIAASDIYVFGVSAETSGRLSTSRLLCSEAIQAVCSPTLGGVDALTILLGAPFVSDRDALCLGGY